MLDPNLLRKKVNLVAEKLAKRGFNLDIKSFSLLEKKRKFLQIKIENLNAKCNFYSRIISNEKLYKIKNDKYNSLYKKITDINKHLNVLNFKLKNLKNKINSYVAIIPNIPADDVPNGHNQINNQEILRWGQPLKYNFPIKDHLKLGENTKGLDFTTSSKLVGARFVVMSNQIALLHRSLANFMLDIHTKKHGYLEHYLPYISNKNSLYNTGQLPKFSKDLFYIEQIDKKKSEINSFALIPTAEVPLVNLVCNKILEEDDLPIKMVAHTPCFRYEAGTYGKNNRGLIRMHQFDKVEIVQIVKPEESMKSLEEITNHAEKILQLLNLPYRKVLLCTSNMSFSSCKTYDLEVWLPSQNTYCEISSCSNTGDFQARRIKARFRNIKSNKISLVHILNGSGLAISRTLAAIMENYQLEDGRIKIPLVLKSYMNGLDYIS